MKILLLVTAAAVAYKVTRAGETFVSNVHTGTASPSFGTAMSDATGLPLTDAASAIPTPVGCQPPSAIDTDLLPKPCVTGDNNFAEFAPNPSALANMNYLDPTKYIGMDTVQGSRRNSSYDLRSNIPIPSCPGAWGQVYKSTIQPDPWRKQLDCNPSLPPAA